MDEGLIVYIESLLSDKESLMTHRRKRLDEAAIGSYTDGYLEKHFTQLQETEWELVIIGKCKEALQQCRLQTFKKNLNQEKKSYARRPSLRETQAMQARNRGGY